MAREKVGKGKRTIVSIKPIKNQKCKDCGKVYVANKAITKDEDGKEFTIITPPRCPDCQTAHLTNLRVNKTIKDLQLLGNLKARLSDVQRTAVIDVLSAEFNGLLDRYSGSIVKASAFDLKTVKAE